MVYLYNIDWLNALCFGPLISIVYVLADADAETCILSKNLGWQVSSPFDTSDALSYSI